jgi:Cu(I)/Ag(I) efflux system membrane fusion protein
MKNIILLSTIILLAASSAHLSANVQQKEKALIVQGTCGMCKTRIEKAAKDVKGVISASWEAKTKQLQLNYDAAQVTVDDISKAVAKSGHDTDKHKADDKRYDGLPGCCKYRK